MGKKIQRLETVNGQLAHEIALLKRHKFTKRSEQLSPNQDGLLDDLLDTDIAAIEAELKAVNLPVAPAEPRQQPGLVSAASFGASHLPCRLFCGARRIVRCRIRLDAIGDDCSWSFAAWPRPDPTMGRDNMRPAT
ncbi:Transposase C of IS166 homeodomain protein [compost metagenome]